MAERDESVRALREALTGAIVVDIPRDTCMPSRGQSLPGEGAGVVLCPRDPPRPVDCLWVGDDPARWFCHGSPLRPGHRSPGVAQAHALFLGLREQAFNEYPAAAAGLPTLADKGYQGAGIGVHSPIKGAQPWDGQPRLQRAADRHACHRRTS